jgi:hypothetical protein
MDKRLDRFENHHHVITEQAQDGSEDQAHALAALGVAAVSARAMAAPGQQIPARTICRARPSSEITPSV